MENPEESDQVLLRWWEQFDDELLTCLIQQALIANPDLEIARERVCQARAIYQITFSPILPQVDMGVSITRQQNSQTLTDSPFLGGRFMDIYLAGFDASWEIDLFGKNQDYAKAAAYDMKAACEQVRDVHVTVAAEVATIYLSIRAFQERIAVTLEDIRNEEELLSIIQERYDSGLISGLDLDRQRALVEERKSQLPQLESLYKQAIYSLSVLIGQIPETIPPLFCEQESIPLAYGKIPLCLPSELLCRRGDIRYAEFTMRAAGTRVIASRKEFFPTINLAGEWGYAAGFFTQWFDSSSNAWNINPSVVMPLFHGGAIIGNVQAQTAIQHQAVIAYEKSILNALKEVESSLVAYFKEQERYQHLQEEAKANRDADQLAQELYLNGITDFTTANLTSREYFRSQNLVIDSKESLMQYLVAIYKALGGGWECCSSP